MPITVCCPGCQARRTLADTQNGKLVRCKQCEHLFTANPAASAAPAGSEDIMDALPGDAPQAPEVRPAKGSGMVIALIAGLGVVAVLLLAGCGGGIFALFYLGRSQSTQLTVSNDPGNAPVQPPIIENENPNPKPAPPPNPRPKPRPRPKPKEGTPAPALGWRVKPDPLAEPLLPPEKPDATLPLSGNAINVLYPSTPSPLVLIGRYQKPKDTREVWNLQTMKRLGSVQLDIEPSRHFSSIALSPDGMHVIGRPMPRGARSPDPVVDVWSVAESRYLGQVKTDVLQIAGIDFLNADEFCTVGFKPGAGQQVSVWNVKTLQRVRQFPCAVEYSADCSAFSPNRKYLAMPGQNQNTPTIKVYELATGTLAGEVMPLADGRVPRVGDKQVPRCEGLAFSSDGKEVAALLRLGTANRITVWDITTGKQVTEHRYPRELRLEVGNALLGYTRPLETLPDNSGWLVYGQLLLDRPSGARLWSHPAAPREPYNARRMLDRDHLLMARTRGEDVTLILYPLPRAEIDARKAAGGK